ncbi:glycosyltransferase [Oceanirhabdus seepicola]|uniref:Glycosyltransferase n=1 Tax=Oceanirhabdus seepicola TaxID=2828781 RepID=A0A9J6NXT2_9CLOT|nr:glycosyltransferase [Oceanirhabdus seepicola]MCM1989258.1 glycosyltransferase [Oceanirhabdus seepicola]
MEEKKKIIFFVIPKGDSFIDYIIKGLSEEYETKKVIVTDLKQIDEGMDWADICWFEWCDQLVIYGSKLELAQEKKIICRLHSYEALTNNVTRVNWDNVDKLIFVAEHIRNIVLSKVSINKEKTIVIPNGIDLDKYNFKEREKGFNIAYVGYINHKKGPMLLLHTFKAIYDKDNRYKLYIAGAFQDERYLLYFQHMIREMGLQNSVIYEGWQKDIDKWLENKNYILCTSVLESQNMSVMQGMSKGIKPLIHNFVGAKGIYPEEYIWNTIEEAVKMISNNNYSSKEYMEFVQKEYTCDAQINKLLDMVKDLNNSILKEKIEEPLVSVIMTVYNREIFLKEAIESVLNQTYKNIEFIIVNDGSTDESENIIKSFKDKRIRYFYKQNSGQLDTLRYGLERSNGEYITRVDSDDKINENTISIYVNEMNKNDNIKFAYCDFYAIDKNSEIINEIKFKNYNNGVEVLSDIFQNFSSPIPDTAFWRKDYIKNVILNYTKENVPYYIDNILTTKYVHINQPLYYYRQHDSNFIKNLSGLKLVVEGKIKFIDLLIRKYFIQLNINKDFENKKENYYTMFAKSYLIESKKYPNNDEYKEIINMFIKETNYWLGKACKGNSDIDVENVKNEIKENVRLVEGVNNEDINSEYIFKNKRALIVSADDPKGGKAVGGKHIHLYLLQKGLNINQISNYLITYNPIKGIQVNFKEVEKEFNINFNNITDAIDKNFVCLVYYIQKQLESKIEKQILVSYVSYINCHDVISTIAAYNVLKKFKIDIPIISTLHGYFTFENSDYGAMLNGGDIYNYFLKYEKRAYEISNKIIAVDNRIKKYVLKTLNKDNDENIVVIKNAINDREFKCISENEKLELIKSINEKSNLIFVPRRLVPKNGVIYVVQAAKELIERGVNDFKLLIAGDGIERNNIINYINDNNLNQYVKLLGSVPHDEIIKYFNMAKIIVVPSIPSNNVEEATSLSALEGMACGKVVIASNIGGLKEIIKDGETGFLVNHRSYKDLADSIINTLKMNQEKYETIGKNARVEIEKNHGFVQHSRKFLSIYDECLD